ncbi:MAG: aconitate hydratase AcnA [Muricauda sp.]|nr:MULTISPECIES: aconitate hydratase AcnA [Allomuricauda]MAU14232.1 aconitate hydratase AcnA [Allomuricauda sp.]MBC73426.1 aconitate hydratase AcnA [Allomuricauda sp.]|tara:strand:- start:10667 stop:13294 length:2628 start_codon:yes stop_codon:yes gene_type:complete
MKMIHHTVKTTDGHQMVDLSSIETIHRLPFSIRILLENVIRNFDGFSVTEDHFNILAHWADSPSDDDVPYKPGRVLMQDFTGVPAIVDIASLRSEMVRRGQDGALVNPSIPVDLIVDHSVQVDYYGSKSSYPKNVAKEYERNEERYEMLKWAQSAFDNFRVVPPGMGICHQVNLENLAEGISLRDNWLFPDTLVGTDSHTPMVNGIGVLGWGVGGIEAEAAMLGQPIYFAAPEVIGLELKGKLPVGTTATDMVLTITNLLREYGVVGKFVEVYGEGLDHLSVPDRATIANMSPEFGCTVTYFPIDERTIDYMKFTGRPDSLLDRVKSYAQKNMLWRTGKEDIKYTDTIGLDLGSIVPTISGPTRPQDKIPIDSIKKNLPQLLEKVGTSHSNLSWLERGKMGFYLENGAVAIAAITSCTNTSNPSVMVGAGLLARNARNKGLNVKPWVKTSLAPGSKVVTDYLVRSGLQNDLEALNFYTVGYGCTSCIGNSGPLDPDISDAINENNLGVAAVLSSNRNFEARIHPQVKLNFLASPLLVIAYAITGTVNVDLTKEPLGTDPDGAPVYLKDIWPSNQEIQKVISESIKKSDFESAYDVIFDGEEQWKNLEFVPSENYQWNEDSTYIKEAPFFEGLPTEVGQLEDIQDARVLLKLGDSITTDHISPAGAFSEASEAGRYLKANGVVKSSFNSYGSRRGNHEVMMRGTFANVRIKNELAEKEGGYTQYIPSGEQTTIYEAAMRYKSTRTDLIVLAGKEYGSGSSRDWAAKGTFLLGVKAVLAESYERIHRSNLVGMGVLPMEFLKGESAKSLGLDGTESFSISGISKEFYPKKLLDITAFRADGSSIVFQVVTRLDSPIEVDYYKNGGILHYYLRGKLKE